MSLGTILLGAALALMLTSLCSAGICDEGPPGKFCFSDLTGYHDCVEDKKTGKIVDELHDCPEDERCTCMGIPCETSTPCGSYTPPITFPAEDYTVDYNDISTVCSPMGCHTTYSHYEIWRDFKNKRFRQDSTVAPRSPSYEYSIYLPNNHSTYDMYLVVPSQTSCTKQVTSGFPLKIPNIPSYFKYNGTETVTGMVTTRWIWFSGGRNSGQSITTQIWNSIREAPVEYRYFNPGSQMSKTSYKFQRYFGLYTVGTPDPEMFNLPNYCEKKNDRHPKPKQDEDMLAGVF